jgi:hypothetical protein
MAFNHKFMETYWYSFNVSKEWNSECFKLINDTWNCVGKILFNSSKWRRGSIYRIVLLGTANWGWGLQEINLNGIITLSEKVPWLLYIMFQLFLEYIKNIEQDGFSINIERPLLTVTAVYKKLVYFLSSEAFIDASVVRDDLIIIRCD